VLCNASRASVFLRVRFNHQCDLACPHLPSGVHRGEGSRAGLMVVSAAERGLSWRVQPRGVYRGKCSRAGFIVVSAAGLCLYVVIDKLECVYN
jgi:hypothetical protein